MKEVRVRCKGCGERFTVIRVDRERTPCLGYHSHPSHVGQVWQLTEYHQSRDLVIKMAVQKGDMRASLALAPYRHRSGM